MKTLNISISDIDFNKFGIKKDKLTFSEIIDLVSKELIISNKNEIDASSLNSGIYLIIIVDNIVNSYSQKLVKN